MSLLNNLPMTSHSCWNKACTPFHDPIAPNDWSFFPSFNRCQPHRPLSVLWSLCPYFRVSRTFCDTCLRCSSWDRCGRTPRNVAQLWLPHWDHPVSCCASLITFSHTWCVFFKVLIVTCTRPDPSVYMLTDCLFMVFLCSLNVSSWRQRPCLSW